MINSISNAIDHVLLVAAVFVGIGTLVICIIVSIIRRERQSAEPKATGETYEPKHEGDLPGWDK